MKDYLGSKVDSLRQVGWLVPFFLLSAIAIGLLSLWWADRLGRIETWSQSPQIGHVTHAFGTVRRSAWYLGFKAGTWWPQSLDESWNRMETGRSILAPVRSGDLVQTGEESAAELLFFGGSILRMESASLAKFEESGDDITIRLLLGRAYLELPESLTTGRKFVFRRGDGSLAEVPEGRRLVLTLNAVQNLDDAMDVENIEKEGAPDNFANVELRFLAHGEEVIKTSPLIVPPIEDKDREPVTARVSKSGSESLFAAIPVPEATVPTDDQDVDIEVSKTVAFEWKPIEDLREGDSKIVAYEIIVRPAPGYEVEDTARKVQVFKTKGTSIPLQRVNGAGTFLWSIRSVTADGTRGPASSPRWLEIKFPKMLVAPKLIKPKVE